MLARRLIAALEQRRSWVEIISKITPVNQRKVFSSLGNSCTRIYIALTPSSRAGATLPSRTLSL